MGVKENTMNILKYFFQKIKDMIDDFYYDKKLGIKTGSSVLFKIFPKREGIYKDGVQYQATPYRRLKQLIDYFQFDKNDVFMDFGSGKGRILFFVAQKELKKVIGVEANKALVEAALQNQVCLGLKTPVEIIHGEAASVGVREGTVFFFFNPFGLTTLTKVLNNIKESLKHNPREVQIVYCNSVYSDFLDSQEWLEREWIMKDEGRYLVKQNDHWMIKNVPVVIWRNK
jgi:precorrin-6B methylase 2